METPTESGAGYPEEQPEDVDPDRGDAPHEQRERQGEGSDDATESGDGTATGNRRSAG